MRWVVWLGLTDWKALQSTTLSQLNLESEKGLYKALISQSLIEASTKHSLSQLNYMTLGRYNKAGVQGL